MCAVNGELHHAIEAGLMTAGDVYAELGEVAAGLKPGRTSDTRSPIADLTGLGVQDTAVANVVMRKAQDWASAGRSRASRQGSSQP